MASPQSQIEHHKDHARTARLFWYIANAKDRHDDWLRCVEQCNAIHLLTSEKTIGEEWEWLTRIAFERARLTQEQTGGQGGAR
jgi:hypothetical protein